MQKAVQAASAEAKQRSKIVAKRWAHWQLGVNTTLSAYGVAVEESDRTSAWKVDFPAKAMVARDKFVHSYKQAVADFDKKSDLDHRIG